MPLPVLLRYHAKETTTFDDKRLENTVTQNCTKNDPQRNETQQPTRLSLDLPDNTTWEKHKQGSGTYSHVCPTPCRTARGEHYCHLRVIAAKMGTSFSSYHKGSCVRRPSTESTIVPSSHKTTKRWSSLPSCSGCPREISERYLCHNPDMMFSCRQVLPHQMQCRSVLCQ